MMDPDAFDVFDYQTGEMLPGLPEQELVEESLGAEPTGAVPATYDTETDRWVYVPPSDVSRVQARDERVRTVYVMEAAE